MAEPVADDAFIVISGHHPQTGKRERISKVRSHITRQYFQKLHLKSGQNDTSVEQKKPLRSLGLHSGNYGHPGRQNIRHPPSRILTSLPMNNLALLDLGSSFAAETTRRLQKFFELHLRRQLDRNPFYCNVIRWAINNPYFTSAKLLNASGWDDILESGELSLWTSRQRFITIRLLEDVIVHEPGPNNKHILAASMQSLLGFELFVGNNQSINHLKAFCESLIANFSLPEDHVWTFITRGHYMFTYVDRLRRSGDNNHDFPRHNSSSTVLARQDHEALYPEYRFSFPIDLSLFTFNQTPLLEEFVNINTLLYDLYQTISIATSCQSILNRASYEQIIRQHERFLTYVDHFKLLESNRHISIHNSVQYKDTDSRITSLYLSILILTSCLLPPCHSNDEEEDNDKHHHAQNLAQMASQLRTLLDSALDGLPNYISWMPFPGALLWCLAIGVRFGDPVRDRTWFLMQFLRVVQSGVLETWEEASLSLKVIVCALERIGPVSVESR